MRDKIYFASDFHLGIDSKNSSKERELLIVRWLMEIKNQAKEIYLVGDIFDYWFEYKSSIPKGFSDFFSALRILRNDGVKISFFTGNHDMWMFGYFKEEYGIDVYKKPQIFQFQGKNFFVAHGDGLGPGDKMYKIVKRVFSNVIIQRLFSLLHPSFALRIMRVISQRDAHKYTKEDLFDADEEWLIQFAEEHEKNNEIDYYVFGHRHCMYDHVLSGGAHVINLGDWINFMSYAEWDGKKLQLKKYGI